MKKSKLIIQVMLFCLILMKTTAQSGKLIEFGWDYPDVNQLSVNLPDMQKAPFDGICFSLQRQIMEAFDTVLHPASFFPAKEMALLKWGKFQNNFVYLRGYGIRGGCWYNDTMWLRISSNMEQLSKFMRDPAIKGILLDPEYYYEDPFYNPWTYSSAQYPGRSYEEVSLQVKKRGREFIKALQKFKPKLELLSIWLASLYHEDLKVSKPQNTRHALLIPFMEGILAGKDHGVKLIEGNEYGYWFTQPSEFYFSKEKLHQTLKNVFTDPIAKQRIQEISIAQPVFYDGLLARVPLFDKGITLPECWRWLEENTRHAIAASDAYTWVYTERVNWWKPLVNDTLNAVISNVRNQFKGKINQKSLADLYKTSLFNESVSFSRMNSGTGYKYISSRKHPMNPVSGAFQIKRINGTRRWQIIVNDPLPEKWYCWFNNRPVLLPAVSKRATFAVPAATGNLVVLCLYADGTEAAAIEIIK